MGKELGSCQDREDKEVRGLFGVSAAKGEIENWPNVWFIPVCLFEIIQELFGNIFIKVSE